MRQIAVLVAVLLLALVFNSFLPKSTQPELDAQTIQRVILEDAKQTYGDSAQYSVVKFEKQADKYYEEIDITFQGGPQMGLYCERTMRRYYNLFPITFREEVYKSNC